MAAIPADRRKTLCRQELYPLTVFDYNRNRTNNNKF